MNVLICIFYLLMGSSLIYIISFWFKAFFAFDNLLKHQHKYFQEEWIKDGNPRGMFWRPRNQPGSLLNQLFRAHPAIVAFKFLFRRPDWVNKSREAMYLHKRYRRFVLYWNIAVPAWSILLLLIIYMFATYIR